MHGDLFDSTIPFGEPELMRASSYRCYLEQLEREAALTGASTRLALLSPSLQADLLRFEDGGSGSEVIEVMAACLRHAASLTIHLQCGDRVVPLTVFSPERLLHCPIGLGELVERHLADVRVMHVEPTPLRPPGDPRRAWVGASHLYHPLTPLLWGLAMRGPRCDLLPEISGPAVYRVAPALEAAELPTTGVLKSAIERLRQQPASLAEIASWPELDREHASRLLNGLYLQAGLIVSRSHPDAVRAGWS
ncbi:MAG: hypothetical protein H7306_27435 [Bacteriovorax sp.]|nr:hypothetical protein [Rhizobacter sp.]